MSDADASPPPTTSPLGSWVSRLLRRSQQNDTKKPSERTSLLHKPTLSSSSSSVSRVDGITYNISTEDEPTLWRTIAQEFLLLLKMSIPVILAYTLQNSLQTISVLVVGRLSPSHLATAAFSYMFATSTAWLIALGGTTALDTLCSSTFTGSKNPHELGILLQRAFVVFAAMYIPVCVLWWFSEPIFLKLGQEPELSRESARFLRYLIPGGLGYIYFEATKKFLQAQGIMRAGTYVLLITSPLSAGLNYLFVYTWKMDIVGAPLATGVSYWLSFAALIMYARFIDGWKAWGGFDRRCLRNMTTFARLAGLGVIMVGTEWVRYCIEDRGDLPTPDNSWLTDPPVGIRDSRARCGPIGHDTSCCAISHHDYRPGAEYDTIWYRRGLQHARWQPTRCAGCSWRCTRCEYCRLAIYHLRSDCAGHNDERKGRVCQDLQRRSCGCPLNSEGDAICGSLPDCGRTERQVLRCY